MSIINVTTPKTTHLSPRQLRRKLVVSLAVDGYRWTADRRTQIQREIRALTRLLPLR